MDTCGKGNCWIWSFIPHWSHNIPQRVSPLRVNNWHDGPVRFMRTETVGDATSLYVPSLIWMMIHIGREVSGLETLLMGRHEKSTEAVCGCVLCGCLCSWAGGEGRCLRDAALWGTSSVIYHSSQAEKESPPCSVSQTIRSLSPLSTIQISSGWIWKQLE